MEHAVLPRSRRGAQTRRDFGTQDRDDGASFNTPACIHTRGGSSSSKKGKAQRIPATRSPNAPLLTPHALANFPLKDEPPPPPIRLGERARFSRNGLRGPCLVGPSGGQERRHSHRPADGQHSYGCCGISRVGRKDRKGQGRRGDMEQESQKGIDSSALSFSISGIASG